ncbi:MAG: pseudouridine synthase [Candidatus Krumholzibacteriia bacterium]
MSSSGNAPLPPCVLHEDDHLLVVDKPAGWNTHAPSPYAGEGVYDWLKHREPRWAGLAIIHRLDKDTSGVMVFGKTPLANRSLTEQFASRAVRKKYVLITDRPVATSERTVSSRLVRAGDHHVSAAHGKAAETRFLLIGPAPPPLVGTLLEAVPLTGRTHQIRVHAADIRMPVLGDTLYGGSPYRRICLHAAELGLQHPESGESLLFMSPARFGADARQALRAAVIEPGTTTAYRLIHGASDGYPGWYVDRLGDFLLSQSEAADAPEQLARLEDDLPAHGSYHKTLSRHVRRASPRRSSARTARRSPRP